MKGSRRRTAARALERAVRGDVLVRDEMMNLYSVDASMYRVVPDVVVIPRDEDDIIGTVNVAAESNLPVTVRGAGTGLVGNALNRGIILDMKNIDRIDPDKIGSGIVGVGAGTTIGRLGMVLEGQGRFFAPNPSVGAFCSIGGMIGCNAGGSRSLKYGSTIDNVTRITFIDGRGNRITLPDDEDVGRSVLGIASGIQRDRFPRVTKNASGYRLDAVRTVGDSHRVLIGSEGTLGIVTSAELKTRDIPEYRLLVVMGYGSIRAALEDCSVIRRTGPAAIEFVDRAILEHIGDAGIDHSTECLLFVEYDEEGHAEPEAAAGSRVVARTEDGAEILRWQRYRGSALHYSLKDAGKTHRIPHIIEDAAVPPERLQDLFAALEGINKRYHTRTITYGHAGDANIHVRLVSEEGGGIGSVQDIAGEYFGEIVRLGGTMSAEHGDGLARSGFVRMQYGKRNCQAFADAKRLFDPKGILNPGKIVTA